MDIDLLSKMVKELILDRDEVTLPGVGTFVAETVPASFSDRGYTINPPYRRLSFRQRQNAEDNCLIELYARSNGIDHQQASRFLLDFLMEMKEVLKQKKSIVFPGLGRLRSTKENNFFFVADEDLDIYPEGFGLEPISLKTHQETPEEVTDAIQKLKAVVMAPADEPEAILEPAPEAQPIAPEAQPIVPAESVSPAEEEGVVAGSVSFTTTVPSDAEEPAAPVESEPAPEAQPIAPAESASPAEEEGAVAGSVSFTTTVPSDAKEPEAPVESEPALEEVVPIELVETEEPVESEPAPEAQDIAPAEGVSPAEEEEVVAGSVSFPTTAPSDNRKAADAVQPKAVPAEKESKKKLPTWAKVLIWVVVAVLAFLLLFAIGARLFPDFFDSILYSHDELDILRY